MSVADSPLVLDVLQQVVPVSAFRVEGVMSRAELSRIRSQRRWLRRLSVLAVVALVVAVAILSIVIASGAWAA